MEEDFIYREFSNHLYLGQWELARACAFIKSNDEDHRKRLFSTLKMIAKNPYVVRSAWPTVSCPSYISLLACQLLTDLGCENVADLRKEADFSVLLESFIRAPQTVLFELSDLYSYLLNAVDPVSHYEISRQVSTSLRNAFAENPVAISKLLNLLCSTKETHGKKSIKSSICDIHLQNLLQTLRSLKAASAKNKNVGAKASASKIYFLLNALPECILADSHESNTDEMFSLVLQLCKIGVLDLSKVNTSFLNRVSPSLIKYFCDFQDQAVDESNVQEGISSQGILKCFSPNGEFSHHGALLETVKNSSHFLQDLLDYCTKEILNGNSPTVHDLLKDPLLSHLHPLLLILSWDSCQDDNSSNNVIEAIKSFNENSSDDVLHAAFNFLKSNTALLDLCMKFYKDVYPNASPNKLQTKSRSIFSSLQSESSLRVIHTSFGLKNFSQDKVKEILNVSQETKHSTLDEKLHLTDKAIYSGYLALTSIIDAVHISCEYKDLLLSKKLTISHILCHNSALSEEESDNESIQTEPESLSECIDNKGPTEAYAKFVLHKLSEAKRNVKSIFPFSFRIEIMENIFSLLFSMSSSLLDSPEACSDSDQGHEGDVSYYRTKDDSSSRNGSKDNISSRNGSKDDISSRNGSRDDISSRNGTTDSISPRKGAVSSGRFVITTVKLKDSNHDPELKYFRQMSSKSTESNSSSGLQANTFLCNELITRDILSLLYDLVIDVKADVYKVMGQSESAAKVKANHQSEVSEEIPSELPKSSKDSIDLPERISRLLHYVNEAKWRYEVVKSGIFQGSFGISPIQQRTPHLFHPQLSTASSSDGTDKEGGIRHPELILGSENISSIFLADLGCTSGASLDLASVLLDMASRTWNASREEIQDLDAKVLSKKKMPLIRGIFRTLGIFSSLVKEFVSFLGEENNENDFRALFWPATKSNDVPFPQALSGFVGSLDCQRFKEEADSWKQTAEYLQEFRSLMKDDENDPNRVQERDISQENKLHMSYKRLSKVLRDLRDWSSETIRPQQVRYENYLSKLLIHLHQVTAAILDCKKQSISADSSVYTSDFSILKESPVELLKKIILQSGVEPEKIEKFAIRMKVDLTHVLAQACLPHVPLFHTAIPLNKMIQAQSISSKCDPLLILNKSKKEWIDPRHPDLTARELLKDLIGMIQDTVIVSNSSGIFTVEELISVSQSSHFNSWMEDCSELEFVDLELLETKNEKLEFFINVTNLAWLHAILFEALYSKSQDKESEALDFSEAISSAKARQIPLQMLSSNLLERLTTQKVLGYCIGQLGGISLFDLRYQLLHAQLPVPKHLKDPPFYQLIGDPKPIWEKYTPPVEPKSLFVLVEGLQFSPKLQVMYSGTIEADLEEAAIHYLDFTMSIDAFQKFVLFPKLLKFYALDFSTKDETDVTVRKALVEGLLSPLTTISNKSIWDSLQVLLPGNSIQNFVNPGNKQKPFKIEFTDPPLSFGIMLDYNSSDISTQPSPTPIASLVTENHPIVLNHLKAKCSILSDLYEIFRNGTPFNSTSTDDNLCIETNAKNLFSVETSHPDIPITYLLAFYKNMAVVNDEEHSWFSSALSPLPSRLFFSRQIDECFSLNMWHKALLLVDLYLEALDSDWTYILLRQLILEHLATLSNDSGSMEPCCYALCIKDPVVRAKTVLRNICKWQDSSAVLSLKSCLSDRRLADFPDVQTLLNTKLEEVLLYKKIFNSSSLQ
ncbi:hypothetical protein JTE90_022223 [Oedothorax gibbosus]|uniref:DUF547 domain-containing protein n=1 Tax=Oedothorax gibbosus TaxID=931172 RepID=A0AAV6UBA3_9ARAC|nr:hypothetical protein JTE90_022223 [Oedothorax gibbosus]